ncbi:MAG: lamin tail domain-containing protein [Candidatus Pacearchaeota archaeon]|jgi:hypothetical protein
MIKLVLLTIVIILLGASLVIAEIRINELDSNPGGTDNNKEWIELYSNEQIDLTGWKIINHDKKETKLNQTFSGYLVINLKNQFLDNDNESIKLIDKNGLTLYQTPVFKDTFNDDRSWIFCDNHWFLNFSSRGLDNNCQINNINNNQNTENKKIGMELDWDEDDIINGNEFYIRINLFNLENKDYDVRVYIYDDEDNEKILSQTYYSFDEEWIDSTEYFKRFIKSPGGNKSKTIRLRIKTTYESLYGDYKIGARLRETNESSYKIEVIENIELKKLIKSSSVPTTSQITSSQEYDPQREKVLRDIENKKRDEMLTGNAIYIGKTKTQDIKTGKSIIYKSKNELIKEYSLYSFIALFVGLIILKILNKKR